MDSRIIPHIVNNQHICELGPDGTAYDAAKQMLDCNVAAVVILDAERKLVGIVTERDITRRVIARDLDPKKTPLADIMTENPDTLAPDDSPLSALELMRTREYRHLPVVDKSGRVAGMVSIRDLYAAVKIELEHDIRETEAFVFGDRYGA